MQHNKKAQNPKKQKIKLSTYKINKK